MHKRYLSRIPLDDVDTSLLIKQAALRIIRECSRLVVDEQGTMLLAKVDGYTFRYYSLASDTNTMPELPPKLANGGLEWPSSEHCINVESSELLFSFALKDDGLYSRKMVRGPWEFEIARAAQIHGRFHTDLPLPPCFPESRCRRIWPPAALRPMRKRRLRMPVQFSVAGYTQCIHELLPAGSDFGQIAAAVGRCYRESRSYDGDQGCGEEAAVTSFGIWGWAGEGPVRRGKRTKRPDMAYWITSIGGCEAAAALLLLLDKEYAGRRSRPAFAGLAGSTNGTPRSAA